MKQGLVKAVLKSVTNRRCIVQSTTRFASRCWKCAHHTPASSFFCEKCNAVQPPSEENLYKYIGMPESFTVQEKQLKDKFRALQAKLHPDRFANTSDKEKSFSDEHSRLLNKAMKTLSEPLERATYMLKSLETKLQDKKSSTDGDLSADGLVEMMEWNEKVAQLNERDKLESELEHVQSCIDDIGENLKSEFSKQDLAAIRESVIRMRYLYSLKKTIKDKLRANN